MAKGNTIPAEKPLSQDETIAELRAQLLARSGAAVETLETVAIEDLDVAQPLYDGMPESVQTVHAPVSALPRPPVPPSQMPAAPAIDFNRLATDPQPVRKTFMPSQEMSERMESIGATGGGDSILKSYDLSGVETNNFRLLDPDLYYEGEITKAELGKSSKGDAQIKLTTKTVSPKAHAGVTVPDSVTLIPTMMWKYKGLLEATNLLSEDGRGFAGNSVKDLVGKRVGYKIKHDQWEGQDRNKINGGYAAPAPTAPQIDTSLQVRGVRW